MFLDTARLPFIEVSCETKSLELNDASCNKNRLLFKYVIPSTVKVPLSTMFLDTARLPLSEVSLETKRRAFNEASRDTKRLLFK